MRQRVLILAAISFVGVIAVVAAAFVFRPAEAQRSVSGRFEYAVINGNYSPYPPDAPTVVSSAVNICYLQAAGCQNEEIKSEVGIAKFLQDERIENNARTRQLVQERAVEVAFSKAIAKLGGEGWEMISAPAVEFDLYYTNPQGNQTAKEGNRTDRQHIWFKRARQ